jgi:hypothetical protein
MNRQQFLNALAKHAGVTLDSISEQSADIIQIDTPKGKVFRANGAHTIVVPFRNIGGQSWKPQAYAEAIELLNYGLDICENKDCDICEEKTQ